MTDYERAVVMAYTGYAMLTGEKLKYFYEYLSEIMKRPVYTHELADPPYSKRNTREIKT